MKKFCLLLGLMLTACSPGNRPQMLGDTNLVAVEGNTPQELHAPENGQIMVYDLSVKKTLFTLAIASGQFFVIDPITRRASINGQPASTRELPGGHDLKIVFTRTD